MENKTSSRRERFNKIAVNRTNKILDMLRLLGNCSNTASYEYSEEEVKKIFTAIEQEVKLQKQKFGNQKKQNTNNRFEL